MATATHRLRDQFRLNVLPDPAGRRRHRPAVRSNCR